MKTIRLLLAGMLFTGMLSALRADEPAGTSVNPPASSSVATPKATTKAKKVKKVMHKHHKVKKTMSKTGATSATTPAVAPATK